MSQGLYVEMVYHRGSYPNEVIHITYCHHIDEGERRGMSERDLLQGCADREHGIQGHRYAKVPSRCLYLL